METKADDQEKATVAPLPPPTDPPAMDASAQQQKTNDVEVKAEKSEKPAVPSQHEVATKKALVLEEIKTFPAKTKDDVQPAKEKESKAELKGKITLTAKYCQNYLICDCIDYIGGQLVVRSIGPSLHELQGFGS